MAAEKGFSQDPPLLAGGPNPCCAKLWKKYQSGEKGRAALRDAVKLLQSENDKLQKEKSALSEVCKEERVRGDSAEASRDSESDARDILEKEIIELKAQITTLQQRQNVCRNGDDRMRISELEEENRRLQQVLGEEKMRSTSEKKKNEEEKSKALEMQKLLKSLTHKSEEYKRLADTDKKGVSDLRASCEKLRNEVNENRAQLAAQVQKTREAHKRAETEKEKAAREKKRADSEKSLTEKNKMLIEVERKKSVEEKSRADHLFAKLQEQKKLNEDLQVSIEAQRKNTMCEKNRADCLLQKLEAERKQIEYLQKKSDVLCVTKYTNSFGKHGRQHVDVVTTSANVKLLKEKLKLKKGQLKHAENVSKLDKARNALMRRELQCLKQDWMQLLSRFNVLDQYLAGGAEGIHALSELNRQPEVHGFEQSLLPRDPAAAPYHGLHTGIAPFRSSTPREYTSCQLPRESCTRPISGTSYELEPPVRSALRTKSKTHRSSCPTSLSDKKFMGSQGKDNLLVPSTDIRNNQSSTVPELPPKDLNDTRKQGNRVLLEVSGDSSRQKALKSSLSDDTQIADKTLSGCRKRKRTKQSLESLGCPSKHDLLNSKLKSHHATASSVLAFNNDRSCLQQENGVMPCVSKDDLQNHMRKRQVVTDKIPYSSGPSSVPSPGAGNACAGSKFASLLCFEKFIKGNCLKLLNLDNDADEEMYRKAMEAPLSPDLPIVRSTITKRPTYNEPRQLVDGNGFEYDSYPSRSDCNLLEVHEPANRELSQNGKLESPCIRIQYCDNVKELCANDKSNAALVDVPAKASCSSHTNTNAVLHLCKEAPNTNRSDQIPDAPSDPGQQTIGGTTKAQTVEPINLTSDSMNGILYFVGVISMKRSNIRKILHYWDTFISQARKLPKEVLVDPLLERVSTDPLLLAEERASLILSLLLWDVSRFTTDPGVDGCIAASSFSNTVKSYMETRLVFLKSNQLDVLISSIEDFLVKKEVAVCDKTGDRNSDARQYCNLHDETAIRIFTKPATTDQFVAACILLASICVKVDRLDVILEVSYKVLQMGKRNLSWTMLALHVFGSVCGEKFLCLKSCNFLMTTIRLVVLLLESRDTSLCLVSSYIQSNRPTTFSSCTCCLFGVDTVSVDVFISSLLDELELCSLLSNNPANSNEATQSSHSGSSGLEINCGGLCNISKQAKLVQDSHKTHNYPAARDLCYFAEIISLLELFGSYMRCEWTYNIVVLRLLKILESCTCEEYSAALLVFVSQLGRFFIDDLGYDSKSVTELRNKLSVLIGTNFTRSRSIPIQFAAIGALLSLLPLTFDKIVATQTRPLSAEVLATFMLSASTLLKICLMAWPSRDREIMACAILDCFITCVFIISQDDIKINHSPRPRIHEDYLKRLNFSADHVTLLTKKDLKKLLDRQMDGMRICCNKAAQIFCDLLGRGFLW